MASCNTAAMYSSGNKELDLVIVQHCVLTELLTEVRLRRHVAVC